MTFTKKSNLMKKQLFILAGFFLLSFSINAQSNVNLVIFSEDGDPFYAYINGVKQNNTAETNVKFTNLTPNISLRIEFENKALPQLKQNMALEAGYEHTARIKRDPKKQLKLRYFGMVPLNEASSGMNTVQYHTAEDSNTSSGNNTSYNTDPNTNSSSTTISQTGSSNNKDGTVSININMPGMNMNVNAVDPNYNTTTSTTVTSSSSSYNSNQNHTSENNSHNTATTSKPNPKNDPTCQVAMNQASFQKMKESIESKPFSETKMSTAKVATQNACLSVSQIKTIASLFSMDEDKLMYAKYAYDHCVDKANYYLVSEVFTFSGTTDELNEFLTH